MADGWKLNENDSPTRTALPGKPAAAPILPNKNGGSKSNAVRIGSGTRRVD
jgi:hypothetical protein